MAISDYHFVTRWRVKGTCKQVDAILSDVEGTCRWWPALYRSAKIIDHGNEHGLGKVVEVISKGFLPYTLRWSFKITQSKFPNGFLLDAFGELLGKGEWTFEQDGEFVNITYDWQVRAAKPFLEKFTFILKPLFALNHDYVMKKGLVGLKGELEKSSRKVL